MTKKRFFFFFLIFSEIVLFSLVVFNLFFATRIFPNVFVAGINLGGLTETQALQALDRQASLPEKTLLVSENQTFEIAASEINLRLDLSRSAAAAFNVYRTGNFCLDLIGRTSSLLTKVNLGFRININEEQLDRAVSVIAGQTETAPVFPSLKLVSGQVVAERGRAGTELNQTLLKAQIGQALALGKTEAIDLPFTKTDPALTDTQLEIYRQRGLNFLEKQLTLKFQDYSLRIAGAEFFKFLSPLGGYEDPEVSYLTEKTSQTLNRLPINAVFTFSAGAVKEFSPSRDGVTVKSGLLKEMLVGNFRTLETNQETAITLDIPVILTSPSVKTGDVNNLGIRELIGKGASFFAGSITNRIHNVNLAASKLKGVLIAPGETFSFNQSLGDVSAFAGFQQAYIIKDGKTILGDGGGVCQVSTTLFRAALNAGLPIVERSAHAYRVGYYEQDSPPGLDATVYGPSTDLKFENNTPNFILIQPAIDLAKFKLVFELYGTKDNRIVKLTKPVVSDVVPPPEDVYQDDPTLPAGKIVQTEHRAAGAKVSFTYTVEKEGQTLFRKTFVSNYRPWANVYLRGLAR